MLSKLISISLLSKNKYTCPPILSYPNYTYYNKISQQGYCFPFLSAGNLYSATLVVVDYLDFIRNSFLH